MEVVNFVNESSSSSSSSSNSSSSSSMADQAASSLAEHQQQDAEGVVAEGDVREEEESSSSDDEEDGHGKGIAKQAFALIREYMGEQIASDIKGKFVQAKGFVKNQRDKLEEFKQKRPAEKVAMTRQLFHDLLSESHNEENAVDVKYWHDRSVSWIDVMQPEGRKWLDVALKTSLLDREVDFSWAFSEEIRMEEELEHQVELDLPRTFPEIDYFQDETVLNSFRRVLRAVGLTCPEIGYVQGLNFIVGFLLLHTKTETEAHRLAVEMLTNPRYNLRGVFVEGLPSLKKVTVVLGDILQAKDPELYAHFQEVGMDNMFFCYEWVISMFSSRMPFDALVHVWDMFFLRGWSGGFFAVALTLIHDCRDQLLQQDFETGCATLKQMVVNPRDDFYVRAKSMTFTTEQILKIEQAHEF